MHRASRSLASFVFVRMHPYAKRTIQERQSESSGSFYCTGGIVVRLAGGAAIARRRSARQGICLLFAPLAAATSARLVDTPTDEACRDLMPCALDAVRVECARRLLYDER